MIAQARSIAAPIVIAAAVILALVSREPVAYVLLALITFGWIVGEDYRTNVAIRDATRDLTARLAAAEQLNYRLAQQLGEKQS